MIFYLLHIFSDCVAAPESLDQGLDCDHRLLDGGRYLGGLVAERLHLGHVLGHAGQVGRTEDVIRF